MFAFRLYLQWQRTRSHFSHTTAAIMARNSNMELQNYIHDDIKNSSNHRQHKLNEWRLMTHRQSLLSLLPLENVCVVQLSTTDTIALCCAGHCVNQGQEDILQSYGCSARRHTLSGKATQIEINGLAVLLWSWCRLRGNRWHKSAERTPTYFR